MEVNLVEILILFAVVYVLFEVIKMNGRVMRLKYAIDQSSKENDMPESPVDHTLKQLLIDEKDVKAVKRVRETLGLSLLDAKKYVDNMKLEGK
ncbi:hypothetical protein V1498_12035 [Peribacillus sp. SCS-26]|uniref:hypothetical protein n=1 Tax=Paraperibacillus marinus TaxID=3115295 RepID=UPI0039062D03